MGTIIKTRVILSDSRTVLHGKALRFADGVIDRIAPFDTLIRRYAGDKVFEFENAALLPGFTNAHCHLELNWCKGKIKYNGSFIDWLQAIRDIKFGSDPPEPDPFPSIEAMLKTGTTTVIDHYSMPMPIAAIRATGIRYFPLREMFEFDNHTPNEKEIALRTAYSFAVHSPYTTSREVALTCRQLADRWGRPLSTHLSEMLDEIEFIKKSNEKIEWLLKKGDAYNGGWKGQGKTPVEYFFRMGLLNSRTYAVHLNYWEKNDIFFLVKSGLTPVFCPKSHRYFGHPRHPIETYQRAGLKVALGTDSLASNDSLNMLEEARLVMKSFPDMPLARLFDCLTINGLRPLNLHTRLGTLSDGKVADLAVWPNIQGDTPDEIIHQVLKGADETLLTAVNGKTVHFADAV